MAQIRPFQATRYHNEADTLSKKLCPPYDIISPEEKKALLAMDPYNFVRLELPEGEDPYATAKAVLNEWTQNNVLAKDAKEGFYIYEEEFTVKGETLKIKGFIAAVKLEEFSKGIVLPHEETLSKAKEDRLNMMKATGSNLSLIYSMYSDDGSVKALINQRSAAAPDKVATTDDGIIHRLWISDDEDVNAKISALFADKKLYIADGHHRYETAINYRNYLREQGLAKEGDKADYVMMYLIDMENDGLVVFPTHRMVKNLPDFNAAEILEKLSADFEITALSCPCCMEKEMAKAQGKERIIGFYAGDEKYYALKLKDEKATDPIADHCQAYKELDVTALHYLILEKYFGIDKANMANQKNLVYTRSFDEAIDKVDSKEFQCSFFLNATKIHQISDVALAGDKMPQKSTYFYPKLTTGLVMRTITD